MVVTGRLVAVAAIAAITVLARPEWSTVLLWIVVVAAVWTIDLVRAPRPSALGIERDGATSLRSSETAELILRVTNTSGRRFVGVVRDAWPPSVTTRPRRHLTTIEPGDRRSLVTVIESARRGSRSPDRITVRS